MLRECISFVHTRDAAMPRPKLGRMKLWRAAVFLRAKFTSRLKSRPTKQNG
jgi:hypothetical protein